VAALGIPQIANAAAYLKCSVAHSNYYVITIDANKRLVEMATTTSSGTGNRQVKNVRFSPDTISWIYEPVSGAVYHYYLDHATLALKSAYTSTIGGFSAGSADDTEIISTCKKFTPSKKQI